KTSLYIPELKNYEITIRELLTHHSRLEDKVWPEPFSHESSFSSYLSKVLAVNPKVQAEDRVRYSDTGYNILGNLLTQVPGLNYQVYIERNILQPAGMHDSGFYSGADGLLPSVAPFKNGQIIPLSQRWPFDSEFFPSEGLITHVDDLNRWVKMVLTMNTKFL